MNTVKKFETFDEMKSYESKKVNYSLRFRKHNEFEKVIMDLRRIKILQNSQTKSKQ